MSLVSGFSHHPVMHHHDGHHYSLHAAAAGRCHEDTGAPPYFTSWLISHADVSPTEYGLAPGYSPDCNGGAGTGSGPDPPPHPHHHHHHHYGHGALVPGGAGAIAVNGAQVGMHHHHHHLHHHAHPRTVKRRPTANRKERRRTQSINSAFAELRECIPNVPADTKLSKIKTLRLATSYISYLMDILDKDGQHGDTQAFKAELKKTEAREERRKRDAVDIAKTAASSSCSSSSTTSSSSSLGDKKTKGRTGWPQHVWALELKQ
ncbi:heart- and neural crest derivatives-expressed protein 2 [Hippocampus zosterae]|uniref:heart- and neural crest derivatives-expressed protein 2 n=1 Tax=Hippocampus zosterae TaxID=109293 RepID=UPI00223D98D3|nr:heart- and neural crest derivatives-expressed protein 2 [Hippocampus zosterae]